MIGFASCGYYGAVRGYHYPIRNRAAAPNTPVLPVTSAPVVSAAEHQKTTPVLPSHVGGASLPTIRERVDPVEMAVRMRIRYLDPTQEDMAADNHPSVSESEMSKSPYEIMQEAECQTCKTRKYQDGSDDPGVSFKTATRLSPEQAVTAVRGHEMEHVSREREKAEREGRKVVQQSVTIHTAICPECGDVYVSGGTTRTTTAQDNRQELAQQAKQAMFGPTINALV